MLQRANRFEARKPIRFTDGAEGMIKWVEDFVYLPIYPYVSEEDEIAPVEAWVRVADLPKDPNPKTGRSYWNMWDNQKEILRRALVMEGGRFIYRLIILCWMRGEGKSLLACLIQLWKFFNWTRQKIMLGANSKDQVKFVHYDIMRDIILNSPELIGVVGERNVQEKEIRILDRNTGGVDCLIRSISTASGIVSNITGYTFSEMFAMKNPTFFAQLDGSIRNIPNALGVIDSTVSDKVHILHQMYKNWVKGKLRTCFYSYRYTKEADPNRYWNPNMDDDQLNDYQVKFPFGEFDRYFLNLWEAGTVRVFSEVDVRATGYIGAEGSYFNHNSVKNLLEEIVKKEEVLSDTKGKGWVESSLNERKRIDELEKSLIPVENLYSLKSGMDRQFYCPLEDLIKVGDLFDTDWAILFGLDMGDPTAIRGQARSILVGLAKGLIGSRTNPWADTLKIPDLKFIYLLILFTNVENHSTDMIKKIVDEANEEYDGIDTFCAERYGTWDMTQWCEERSINFEPTYPNYGRQRDAFKEAYTVVKEGRFKTPDIPVAGSKTDNLFLEELSIFDHDPIKKWFGSPEKEEKGGTQDDSVYSLGWCMYGGRMLGPQDFRVRKNVSSFGMFIPATGLVGKYT